MTARYKIILVVIAWIIDKLNKTGIGIFKKYGKTLTIGTMYKILYRSENIIATKKYAIVIKIA